MSKKSQSVDKNSPVFYKTNEVPESVLLDPGRDTEGLDFRDVPASDRGNADYSDRGGFGSYAPSPRDQFRDPDGVRHFAGYGASQADIERGYVEPSIREAPAYDLVNYKERYAEARSPDEDFSNPDSNDSDYEFRGRARRSRGFLRRPHIPTER